MLDSNLYTATGPVVSASNIALQSKARPLSRSLEAQLVALCTRQAPYCIEALPCSTAPETLDDIARALSAPCNQSNAYGYGQLRDDSNRLVGVRVPVWHGGSRSTIWSAPNINYLFRAWHDNAHLALGADIDQLGELRVARHACAQITGKPERAILWAETYGQVLYHVEHGAFPHNQRQFVRDCIRFGVAKTVARGVYHREAK
jgi:hypothetical protein